jgi:hypothetical protein
MTGPSGGGRPKTPVKRTTPGARGVRKRVFHHVQVYESREGVVYLRRDNTVWSLGPVTHDMQGGAWRTALGWCRDEWRPGAGQTQVVGGRGKKGQPHMLSTILADLRFIAEWTTTGQLTVVRDTRGNPIAGPAGTAYLGLGPPPPRQ